MYVVHVRRIPIRSTCTTYMYDSVNIHRTCTAVFTLSYMYGVHVRRTCAMNVYTVAHVRRTCMIV